MNGAFSIEAELKRRTESDKDAKDFLNRYENMQNYLVREYYRWIQANCPFFTDHGEKHIKSVIQAASLLLSKHLNPDSTSGLSSLDLFLLLSGILWHDVGNVLGRVEHADRVPQMTEEIKKFGFPNPDIHRLVVEISRAHAGKDGLNIPRPEEDCTTPNRTYTVYSKALAAIVRFADEISEDRSRISQSLLLKVPDENRVYWEYANCISASKPDPARERVVVTVAMQHDNVTAKFSCPELTNRVNGTGKISLIEYILCRLEKMNNERAYCASEFRKYLSIREIEVRFTIFRGTDRIESYDDHTVHFGDSGLHQSGYPNIQIFDEFFEHYPSWNPEKLEEVLR